LCEKPAAFVQAYLKMETAGSTGALGNHWPGYAVL